MQVCVSVGNDRKFRYKRSTLSLLPKKNKVEYPVSIHQKTVSSTADVGLLAHLHRVPKYLFSIVLNQIRVNALEALNQIASMLITYKLDRLMHHNSRRYEDFLMLG